MCIQSLLSAFQRHLFKHATSFHHDLKILFVEAPQLLLLKQDCACEHCYRCILEQMHSLWEFWPHYLLHLVCLIDFAWMVADKSWCPDDINVFQKQHAWTYKSWAPTRISQVLRTMWEKSLSSGHLGILMHHTHFTQKDMFGDYDNLPIIWSKFQITLLKDVSQN